MTRPSLVQQLAALVLVCAATVASADYPSPRENHVNDYAQRLSESAKESIRNTLSALERDTGVEISVAVIKSVADYGTGDTAIEPFATGLFNNWGVGDRGRNDGILLLVAVSDREVRIELGSGYGTAADAVASDIIEREILPNFRKDLYGKGTRAGADALAARVRAGALPLNSGLSAWMSNAGSAARDFDHWPEAGAGGVVLFLFYGVWRYFARRRPRQCPKCRTTMRLLSELADNQYLNAGERLEENLDSVDYDVWQCPGCKTTEKIAYKSWFSSYKRCPKCNLRALEETTQVLQAATHSSSGSRRIREECRSCRYRSERTETIPQKQESGSTSSGRSSFGGGKSSGRGASGRW